MAILISTVGCSKEPTPVHSITQLPHSMPISTKSNIEPILNPATMKFKPVFFDVSKADINTKQISKLDSHIAILINDQSIRIKLIGNASSDGILFTIRS